VRDEAVLVLTAPVVVPPEPLSAPVELLAAPDEGWLDRYGRRSEMPPGAREVLTSGDDVVFAAVRTDGPAPALPAAVARGVLTDGWLGVSALTVTEEHRRRGVATAVMAALTLWAVDRGAHSVYLQVTAGNTAARALYRRAGFIEHHRYHYRRRS
jgi:GNAT superfamily N-acetyltransferase